LSHLTYLLWLLTLFLYTCRYVGLTRAKNFCVVFDRNGEQRAPLYHFLRSLGLGSHVSSVLGGGLAGAVRGSLSNNPLEWSKRAANLVETKLFKLAAQCYGSAGDLLRAAAYGAMGILHVSMAIGCLLAFVNCASMHAVSSSFDVAPV
jgi:hypothetical protein